MKDKNIYLNNILDKANEAIDFCKGIPRKEFLKDNKTQSAVILKLIIIGEEAKKLSEKVRSEVDLPWKMIISLRNIAIHEYFDVDLVEIYKTVRNDLPELINKIEKYLKN